MSKIEAKKDRQPYCGKCRNHGEIVFLKGHKKDCRYQKCVCKVCVLGVLRRDVNKEQNELKKQGKIVKSQITTPLLLDATPLSPASTISTNSLPSSPLDDYKGGASAPISRRLSELEEYSYSADQLVKILELDIKALPFAYAVLSEVGSFDNAILKIHEANRILVEMNATMESEARITSSNDVDRQQGLVRPYYVNRPGMNPSGVIHRSPENSNDNMETEFNPNIYPLMRNRFNY